MSLTITLNTTFEQMLRDKATREGQQEAEIAVFLIQEALEWEAADRIEAIKSIQKSLDDFEAGRYKTLNQFASEKRTVARL